MDSGLLTATLPIKLITWRCCHPRFRKVDLLYYPHGSITVREIIRIVVRDILKRKDYERYRLSVDGIEYPNQVAFPGHYLAHVKDITIEEQQR